MDTQARELFEIIRRRAAIIERLTAASQDKRDLTQHLDVSRQTVDRALRELQSNGLIDRHDGQYRPTLFGEFAYHEFESLLKRYERLWGLRDLLSHLPTDTPFEVDPFLDATVSYADHPLPHEPIRRSERLIEEAGSVVGYSPIAFPQYVELFHRQITETDMQVELYLDASLVERLRLEYRTELEDALSVSAFTLYQVPEPLCLHMGITVLDGSSVWVGVYDDTGNIVGTIVTDGDPALAWAEEMIGRCHSDGRKVFLRSS